MDIKDIKVIDPIIVKPKKDPKNKMINPVKKTK